MLVENEKDWAKYRGLSPVFAERVRAKRAEVAKAERQARAEAAKQAKVDMEKARMSEIERDRALAAMEVRVAGLENAVASLKQESAIHRALIQSDREQFIAARRRRTTFSVIMRRATLTFDVRKSEIIGSGRNARVVLARQFVMYWSRRLTDMSYPHIGRLLGNRDHTSVIHGVSAWVAKRAGQGRGLRPLR